MWQIPSAWPSTGIFVFSFMNLTSLFPPLGIIKLIYLSHFNISATSSRVNTCWITFLGNSSIFSSAEVITDRIFLFVFIDSFPPFKITAFADFIASDEIWAITSGLASKIIPKTPIGQDTLYKVRSLSSSLTKSFLFTGSSSFAISLIPWIISRILFSSSFKRLNVDFVSSPDSTRLFAVSKSVLLASKISSLFNSISSAIFNNAVFFNSVDKSAIFNEASFASFAIFTKSIIFSLLVWENFSHIGRGVIKVLYYLVW